MPPHGTCSLPVPRVGGAPQWLVGALEISWSLPPVAAGGCRWRGRGVPSGGVRWWFGSCRGPLGSSVHLLLWDAPGRWWSRDLFLVRGATARVLVLGQLWVVGNSEGQVCWEPHNHANVSLPVPEAPTIVPSQSGLQGKVSPLPSSLPWKQDPAAPCLACQISTPP